MIVSITESDGTKRTMQGAIYSIDIDITTQTLKMQVVGITSNFEFSIKGNVHISESEAL